MKIHILQHVPFEGPGNITSWLDKHHIQTSFTRFYENPALPPLDAVDGIIVLGGTMNVNESQQYPWLVEETAWLTAAIQAQKKILGICLGAQLLARCMNKNVYACPYREIGWWPISLFPNAFIDKLPHHMAFHWHGQTFDLPDHAQLIASTPDCPHQIFSVGKNILGMQCHLESTEKGIEDIVQHCGDELVSTPEYPVKFIQPRQQLLDDSHRYASGLEAPMHHLLDQLFQP